MQKPNSLRAAITAALPDLGRDADRLQLHVEKGRIVAAPSGGRGFAWHYTLTLIATDFTAHPSILFLAINDWLRTNQPDLLGADAREGYSFEAEIVDSQTVDVMVSLKLDEVVAVTTRDDGGTDLQHLAEPTPTWPDDVPLADVPLTEGWAGGTRLAP